MLFLLFCHIFHHFIFLLGFLCFFLLGLSQAHKTIKVSLVLRKDKLKENYLSLVRLGLLYDLYVYMYQMCCEG